jgi:hypothetical protein
MPILLNNCRARDHASIYPSPVAFFDIDLTGGAASADCRAVAELRPGAICIVATTQNNNAVELARWEFSHSQQLPDDEGTQCLVLFGRRVGAETMPKADAANHRTYSQFFNIRGHFKQQSVLRSEEPAALTDPTGDASTRPLPP